MKFITVRDLRKDIARLRETLAKTGEIVITANGRPFAILSPVAEERLEESLDAIRRSRALMALEEIWRHAQESGLDRWSEGDVEDLVSTVRTARRRRERRR